MELGFSVSDVLRQLDEGSDSDYILKKMTWIEKMGVMTC